MLNRFQSLAVAGLLYLSVSPQAHAYYGAHANEAILTFKAYADVAYDGKPTLTNLKIDGSATQKKALAAVDEQVQFLMGTFQSKSFLREFNHNPGVLGDTDDITFTNVEPGSKPGRVKFSYNFKGHVVFKSDAFADANPVKNVPIKLPYSPDLLASKFYDAAANKNPCSDPHYPTPGDFFYFWDPDQTGCPLKGNGTDVVRVTGTLLGLPNTSEAKPTYPEYDQLYGTGKKPHLDVAIFIGYIDDLVQFKWPRRNDDGKTTLKLLETYLGEKLKFTLTSHEGPFRENSLGRKMTKAELKGGTGIDYLRVYEKEVTANGNKLNIRVKILLADTMIDSKDSTFHNYWKPALETADIIYYDGHSGLGGNLDLKNLPQPINFDMAKYQIIFFNGCSSYPYFNGMYSKAKHGTKYLDIITAGLPTFTDTSEPNAKAFLQNFLEGETNSWQEIMNRLDSSNKGHGTYLDGVKGDEDNKWSP